jgi:hypothetical protein
MLGNDRVDSGFVVGPAPFIMPAMKSLMKSSQGAASGFFISALLVSLAVAGRAQMVEVDEMRKQAENSLAEAEDNLGCLYLQGRGVPMDS